MVKLPGKSTVDPPSIPCPKSTQGPEGGRYGTYPLRPAAFVAIDRPCPAPKYCRYLTQLRMFDLERQSRLAAYTGAFVEVAWACQPTLVQVYNGMARDRISGFGISVLTLAFSL